MTRKPLSPKDDRPLKTYICRPAGCGPCIREYAEPPEGCCIAGCWSPGFMISGFHPRPVWYELVPVVRP
jgi:hypothetical protein